MIKKWNTIVYCVWRHFLLAAKPSPKSTLLGCLYDYVQDTSLQSWKYYSYALIGETDSQNVLTVAVQSVFWGFFSFCWERENDSKYWFSHMIELWAVLWHYHCSVLWHISVCKLHGNALHSLCYTGPCVPRTLISPAEINFLSLLRLNFLCYGMTFSAS